MQPWLRPRDTSGHKGRATKEENHHDQTDGTRGIVVDDIAAATEFFVELGLELRGEGPVEGHWVDRVVGLDGVRAEIAVLQTPNGHGRLELTKFHTPTSQDHTRDVPANTPGIRHVAIAVEDIDAVVAALRARGAGLVGELERYENSCRLGHVRGPEGVIVELADQISKLTVRRGRPAPASNQSDPARAPHADSLGEGRRPRGGRRR